MGHVCLLQRRWLRADIHCSVRHLQPHDGPPNAKIVDGYFCIDIDVVSSCKNLGCAVRKHEEKTLSQNVSDFLGASYPLVVYRFDYGADVRLTKSQAVKMKRLQGKWSQNHPDLFISEPIGEYHGLYIELKVERVMRLDGKLKKDKHLQGQAKRLALLNKKGYFACFCIGLKDTTETIDNYMGNLL